MNKSNKIYLQNVKELTKTFPKLTSKYIEHLLKDFPKEYIKKNINIVFVTEAYIKNLNLDYRKKDYVTDVLSFNLDGDILLGEVYICPGYVSNNFEIEKQLEEVLRLIVHGILHLNNFDHTIEFREEKYRDEAMYVVQENILSKLMSKI